MDAIESACDGAEKVMSAARKSSGIGVRSGPQSLAALQMQVGGQIDKEKAGKVAEVEKSLRAALATGEGEFSLTSRFV